MTRPGTATEYDGRMKVTSVVAAAIGTTTKASGTSPNAAHAAASETHRLDAVDDFKETVGARPIGLRAGERRNARCRHHQCDRDQSCCRRATVIVGVDERADPQGPLRNRRVEQCQHGTHQRMVAKCGANRWESIVGDASD